MNNLMFFNKSDSLSVGDGLLYSLVSILLVFAILLTIIIVCSLVSKLTISKKDKKIDGKISEKSTNDIEIKDDDMMAAVLVATIDYRNEVKKDVKVVSVKEIK